MKSGRASKPLGRGNPCLAEGGSRLAGRSGRRQAAVKSHMAHQEAAVVFSAAAPTQHPPQTIHVGMDAQTPRCCSDVVGEGRFSRWPCGRRAHLLQANGDPHRPGSWHRSAVLYCRPALLPAQACGWLSCMMPHNTTMHRGES